MGNINEDTQVYMVLEHMKKHGSITSMDAIMRYHITRLAVAIYKLRHKYGYAIDSQDETGVNDFGRKVKYTRYILRGEAEDEI